MTARQHRYPLGALLGDGLRSVFGAGFCALLLTQPVNGTVAAVLAGLLILFGWFGLRTGLRRLTVIEVDDGAIRCSGACRRVIAWNELIRVKLRYYSTKRDRQKGWMELILIGRTSRLRLESTLDGFDHVAKAVVNAIRQHEIAIDDGTIANFLALGYDPDRRADHP